MTKFFLGPEIIYGTDSLNYLQRIRNQAALIVTDEVIIKVGLVDRIISIFNENNVRYEIFSEVEPDPSLETVKKGLAYYMKDKPDVLLTIGGGSAIDVAKAILFFYLQLQKQFVPSKGIIKPLFIAIPTTSGSGSEVTSYAVITDKENELKIPLSNDEMIPNIAILDEALTTSLPPSITADTGMDVLTHAIEAYVSKNASEFTDMYALKAIKLVFHHLITAFEHGENATARKKMHIASCMAGISFTNAGLGINHSLAHAVGNHFHLSHGRVNAVLLPYVIQFNGGIYDNWVLSSPVIEKYAEILKELGSSALYAKEGVLQLANKVKELNVRLNLPTSFKELGIVEDAFEQSIDDMASSALEDLCTSGNPKQVTKNDLVELLRVVYHGG
ncbi:1-propanol dehydrogenase PduQ [Salipaludibacillus daqingensis]|uniref:1-propanol dehydrogenase PduQ n=1 Tax=Salipaludibacillus daqingensis TaxID=3041001 RepID=UPI00247666CD|nr:1-propanol dehydrogenase PduQ [Salipaludibacillus daqingensis]